YEDYENKDNLSYRRSAVVVPKTTTQFNQFLPTKDKASGYVPAPLRKKRAERNEDNRRSWASSSFAEDESSLTRYICPDLENDDMFARRTLAFQSNTNLAKLKTLLTCRHRRCTSEPQLNIVTQKPVRGGAEETEFPDIEQDDVVFRREKTQQAQQQRPLSGAPDNYAPMPIPEPWALPPDLKSRLLCPPCPLTHKAAIPNLNEVDKEARPETDDMLIRKFRICSDQSQSSASSASQKTPSVPSSCSKEDLQKWQAIREASQLRHKKRLLVERLAALKL
uniref:LIM domain 7a n=1 Tax=Neolamprologus brichardi TaxID=32507 RepID=A0A3Q4G3U8_NEOBR